jgi:transcriptional regulator with XRE-family HTH domain
MVRNRIAILRKENNMNQRELSEKLGVVQATVSAWETGRNEPDNETLQKLADLFRVNFGYVAGFEPRIRRRMTEAEEEEYFQKKNEEKFQKYLEDLENGFTEEEIERIQEEQDFQEYIKNEENMFFEAYLFNKACEFMTAEQRKRALNGLKGNYPKAFASINDPD